MDKVELKKKLKNMSIGKSIDEIHERNGYVLIEKIENQLHPSFTSSLYHRLYKLYLRKIKKTYDCNSYSVTIFIASGKSIDKKIDTINRRLKFKSEL